MITGSTTLDSVSNETGMSLSFTFRKQPTNGEDTGARFLVVIPKWRKAERDSGQFV